MSSEPPRTSSPVLPVLIVVIAVAATSAALVGILSDWGPGLQSFQSIRGRSVPIHGRGVYRHMSAEVAIQGIAQDYVTAFLGVPLLVVSHWRARDGGLRARFLLAGVLAYFFVTYLFYLTMAMYNALFLVYAVLLGSSFFALAQVSLSLAPVQLRTRFSEGAPMGWAGAFLMFTSSCIGLLWLRVVIPPLLDGSVVPVEAEHYTTLVVQGLDLGLLLPLGFVAGLLLVRRRSLGYLIAPMYLVFLSLLMAALLAKLVFMAVEGYAVMPAILVIPAFLVVSVAFSLRLLVGLRQ